MMSHVIFNWWRCQDKRGGDEDEQREADGETTTNTREELESCLQIWWNLLFLRGKQSYSTHMLPEEESQDGSSQLC